MELKLYVTGTDGNAKTYTADTIDCRFGIVEDILNVLDVDNLDNKASLAAMIIRSSKQLKPFLKDLFEGVTDEELRSARTSNIIQIFKDIYSYAVNELGTLNKSGN